MGYSCSANRINVINTAFVFILYYLLYWLIFFTLWQKNCWLINSFLRCCIIGGVRRHRGQWVAGIVVTWSWCTWARNAHDVNRRCRAAAAVSASRWRAHGVECWSLSYWRCLRVASPLLHRPSVSISRNSQWWLINGECMPQKHFCRSNVC